MPMRQQLDEDAGERPELRRAGGPLAVGDLLADEVHRGRGVEAGHARAGGRRAGGRCRRRRQRGKHGCQRNGERTAPVLRCSHAHPSLVTALDAHVERGFRPPTTFAYQHPLTGLAPPANMLGRKLSLPDAQLAPGCARRPARPGRPRWC